MISKYENELGISADETYAKYMSQGSGKLTSSGEMLVTSLSRAPVKKVSDLLASMGKAMQGSTTINNQSTTSSGKNTQSVNGLVVSGQNKVEEVIVSKPEGFSDLDGVAWAKDAIDYLYKRKIVSGVGEDKFDPDGIVTREAFTKMTVDALGVHNSNAVSHFEDVKEGMWYTSYVASGAESGIIAGISETLFGTGMSITREDVSVIIARAAAKKNLSLKDADESFKFADDSEISDYAKESVYKLYASGIISGMDKEHTEYMVNAP